MEKEKKLERGRPTKYNAQFHPLLAEKMARLGYTNDEMAAELNIAPSTFDKWKAEKPKFSGAIEKGKNDINKQVENALLKNALGYEEEDTKIFCSEGDPVYAPYIKKHKPETKAAELWLRNRDPKRWREQKEIKLSSEEGAPPIQININPVKNENS